MPVAVPTTFHLDVLRELINTGVGRAASSLNDLLGSHVELQVPSITFFKVDDVSEGKQKLADTSMSCVQLGFSGPFGGTAALVFPPKSAMKLVSALTGEMSGTPYLNEVMAGTLNEVGNIVINAIMGTIGNYLHTPIDFSVPNYLEGKIADFMHLDDENRDAMILLVKTYFRVQDREIEGNIFLIFEVGTLDALLKIIDHLHAEV